MNLGFSRVDRGLWTRSMTTETEQRRSEAGVHRAARFHAAVVLLATALLLAACAKRDTHALKGVIVDIYAEPPALLVKHDEIPGVMAAMTMKFGVDAATVARVQKGQQIEGRMRFQDGKWRLEDVRIIPSP
jgi:Cu/Ag efflux protein CusF